MANAPIQRPRLHQTLNGWATQTSAFSDGGNTFSANQFLKLSSGVLAAYVADDFYIAGLCQDPSHTSTDEPYTAPFGENHNLILLNGQRFIMNITDASGTVGSGSTTQANVAVGNYYSARYLATIDTGCLAIDAADGGTPAIGNKYIFKVVALWPQDASGDFNGRVIVEVATHAIQAS